MHLLIKGVTITDPNSPYHNFIKDIRIVGNTISEIGDALQSINEEEEVWDYSGKNISTGWVDVLASFGDPGFEQKEDLLSGADAAMHGGFTHVCCMPNTNPVLQTKSDIEYVINKNKGHLVTIHPLGAVTKNLQGKDLTEMYDMRSAGAIAFTDADHAISDDGILLRSLQYVKPFNGTIINIPNDHVVVGNANVNEGVMSMQLGMYGIPDVLEELMVIRDIKLSDYTKSKLHIACISSARAIAHIREAKKEGVPITASVSGYQLFFNEQMLAEYDTNFKVNPPLRTAKDNAALLEAIADGTIDTVCSYHLPHESDAKELEFEYAAFGMATLEATFGAFRFATADKLNIEKCIEKFTSNPRKVIGLPIATIQENAPADLTIFDADVEWQFNKSDTYSKAFNNPFIGKTLKGKALAVIANNQFKKL
ncbi:MAG: dihydroorotase [Chitinophagales bacterium]|nr:dihydroorotase [Chitinophagales bacterium]MBP8754586.1 dihydroorotase [Chitinophagales bacterium]MBP9705339.1 dihydroorotase [Chitinophagales bacterium]